MARARSRKGQPEMGLHRAESPEEEEGQEGVGQLRHSGALGRSRRPAAVRDRGDGHWGCRAEEEEEEAPNASAQPRQEEEEDDDDDDDDD